MTLNSTEVKPMSILMPTKDPEVFIFMFACPKCDHENEALITTVGQKAVLNALALSHYVSHHRPYFF